MALRLKWDDERYVRIYCRDTIDWQALSWHAQALYVQINRRADRRGRIDLGRPGRRGIGALLGRAEMWPEPLEAALAELEADGCVHVEDGVLVIADFKDAQECSSSGKARTAKWRDERRARGDETSPGEEAPGHPETDVTDGDGEPPNRDETSPGSDETSRGDETSQKVTRGYSTARKARNGTARPPADGNSEAPPAPAGPALSAAFEADLDDEATKEDERRTRTLAAIGPAWRNCIEVAAALGRKPNAVWDDLIELKKQGLVERADGGNPAAPTTHWRRVRRGVEETQPERGEDAA